MELTQPLVKVPFYPNNQAGGHSMLAVYRMVLAHFAHKELTWEQLDELCGHKDQHKVSTVKALTRLANDYSLSVSLVEPFNYKRLAREGKDYLYELYDNEEVEWYDKHSDLTSLGDNLTKFLATVRPDCRRATLEDIDGLLDEGRLVSVTLDGTVLSGESGSTTHAILVIGREGDNYIVHDPGPPAGEARHIPRELLWQAMGGEQNMSEVAGYMPRKAGLRLDQYVIREKPSLSRAYATRLIAEGRVLVNGRENKAGYKLRQHDAVTIDYDEADEPDVPDIDLPVLYEDDDCVVINKPAGVLTHNKGTRFIEATVASFVRGRAKHLSGERPGIVHRLDRATSGVIICAKTPAALSHLQKQFHDRTVQKTYAAVVLGGLKPEAAIIDMPIERNPKAPATFRVGANGKTAQTYYETQQTSSRYSLLELQPKTGRTHQLRVHLGYQHHPIVGDTLYGGELADRLYLHAHHLTIALPNGETKTFTAPLPPEFTQKLED